MVWAYWRRRIGGALRPGLGGWSRPVDPISNDVALSKPCNLGLSVAEAHQHLLVMLAELRCNASPRWRFRKQPRRAVNPQSLAVFGILHFAHVAIGKHIGVAGRLEHGIDWGGDDVGGPELGHPVVARIGRKESVQQGQQFGPLFC